MIRRIEVAGNSRVAEEDVLATIRLRRGVPCTDAEVGRDARSLWDLGYFDDIQVEADEAPGERIDLTFRVHERPAIGRIVFEGNDEVDDDDLDGEVDLREGAILSVPDVREAVTKIRDFYAGKGYFLARVQYVLRRMGDNEVQVTFRIVEGPEVAVRRIRFIGNNALPDSELLGLMRTSETGFFSFLSSSDTFKRTDFDEDVNRLQAYYYDKGYLDVAIGTPRIELTADRRHIDITIPVDEGPRFRIGRLRVAEVDADGQEITPLEGRRRLREMVTLSSGEWFNRTSIARDLLEITRAYRDHGYAHVDIRPETDLNRNRRLVHVVVLIQRGPLVRIERINIRGNTKTRDLVIRRELRIVEGELYNQTRLEESKARVTALGYFERVDTSEEEGSTPDRIVVNFEVAERPTGTFQVGAGFSSIESFIFTAQVQQQNFLGRGLGMQLQLQLSGIRQLAQIQLTEPYFFGSEWSASLSAYKTIRLYQTFNVDTTGGSLTFGHPVFSDYLRFFIGYTGELVDISARSGGLFGAGRGFNLFQRLPLANLFRDGFSSSIRLSLTWDSRDNRLFPTSGIYASFSTEIADQYVGSENNYVRHRGFFRAYYPLFGGIVAKLNVEGGVITSRDPEGVPIFERFFLGGIFDVRGFNLRSIGPRAGLPRSTDPTAAALSEGEVFGGNAQAFYNLEIEFPILEEVGIRGVVFTDGGNTWNLEQPLCDVPRPVIYDSASAACGVDLMSLRTSWGFGVRWFSPLGPLRFEWGLPFRPRSYERDLVFEFTIGNFF